MRFFKGPDEVGAPKQKRAHGLAPRVAARRNKLLGIWAAGHMGLKGEDAALYAMGIVEAGIDGDDKALCHRVCSDLVASGFPIVERDIHQQLDVCSATAHAQCARDAGCDK